MHACITVVLRGPTMWCASRKRLAGLVLATVSAVALLAPAAQATPIQFYNDVGNTQGTPRFTIGCGGASTSCNGMLEALTATSPLAWSSALGVMLGGPSDASPPSETTFVNGLLGTSLIAGSAGNITPAGNGNGPLEFTTDADYIFVKVGGGPTHQAYALLHNLGGTLDLWFTATGQAGGLSHYITFDSPGGTPTPVPEPGAVGMFALGLGLTALGYGLRRRRPA